MGKISVFDHIIVDGFFAGPQGEIDWFKDIPKDAAYEKYIRSQSREGSTLLFGRTTYEMMHSFWPTDTARKMDPDMAEIMNQSPKIVFSKTLKDVKDEPDWKNVRLMSDIKKNEIEKLKEENQTGFTILGSGTLVQQLTRMGLIDNYTLVTVPVVLGKGKLLFDDVTKLNLRLKEAKSFDNGISVHHYEPNK